MALSKYWSTKDLDRTLADLEFVPDSFGRADRGTWRRRPSGSNELADTSDPVSGLQSAWRRGTAFDEHGPRLFALSGSVGTDAENDPQDVVKARVVLDRVGFHSLAESGPTGTIDEAFEQDVRRYQKHAGITADGLIEPEGPTLAHLTTELALQDKADPAAAAAKAWINYRTHRGENFPSEDARSSDGTPLSPGGPSPVLDSPLGGTPWSVRAPLLKKLDDPEASAYSGEPSAKSIELAADTKEPGRGSPGPVNKPSPYLPRFFDPIGRLRLLRDMLKKPEDRASENPFDQIELPPGEIPKLTPEQSQFVLRQFGRDIANWVRAAKDREDPRGDDFTLWANYRSTNICMDKFRKNGLEGLVKHIGGGRFGDENLGNYQRETPLKIQEDLRSSTQKTRRPDVLFQMEIGKQEILGGFNTVSTDSLGNLTDYELHAYRDLVARLGEGLFKIIPKVKPSDDVDDLRRQMQDFERKADVACEGLKDGFLEAMAGQYRKQRQ